MVANGRTPTREDLHKLLGAIFRKLLQDGERRRDREGFDAPWKEFERELEFIRLGVFCDEESLNDPRTIEEQVEDFRMSDEPAMEDTPWGRLDLAENDLKNNNTLEIFDRLDASLAHLGLSLPRTNQNYARLVRLVLQVKAEAARIDFARDYADHSHGWPQEPSIPLEALPGPSASHLAATPQPPTAIAISSQPAEAKASASSSTQETPESIALEVDFDAPLRLWAKDNGHDPDAKPVVPAYYERFRTVERFAAFIGHRNASAITKSDVLRWKESMQVLKRSAGTVRNDLSEMSAIWAHAIKNTILVGPNPFEGMLPSKPKTRKRAVRRFTNEEAEKLITAAKDEKGYLHWLPAILFSTGARLGEICQSLKEDITIEDGVVALRIHEEGELRSVKDHETRFVPIHSALKDYGFIEYIASLPKGSSIFPEIEACSLFGRKSSKIGKDYRAWVRSTLNDYDEKISPAHSARHWFITAARKALVHPEVRDTITGHSTYKNEGDNYGEGFGEMLTILADQIELIKIPGLSKPSVKRGRTGTPVVIDNRRSRSSSGRGKYA